MPQMLLPAGGVNTGRDYFHQQLGCQALGAEVLFIDLRIDTADLEFLRA